MPQPPQQPPSWARRSARLLASALTALIPFTAASAQRGQYYEQTYLPGAHSFAFNDTYPAASRLFNAFDYGHAILYQQLWQFPTTGAQHLEQREHAYISKTLLRNPPRLPLDEHAVGTDWSLLAPETLEMFNWAHMLHRQLYDVLTRDADAPAERDAHVAALLRYYRSRSAVAFSAKPKDMTLMEGQPYSLAFRQQAPTFNGLIWSYHWVQMTLYDALLAGATKADRDANVNAVVRRFFVLVDSAPPSMMPMSPGIAPLFSSMYPDAAIIFDNLHSLHDVVSDILANPNVPRAQKRATILQASARYRDDTTRVTSVDEWVSMANAMGLAGMGGPAPLPNASAPRRAAPSSSRH